jgi:O-antigen ligase
MQTESIHLSGNGAKLKPVFYFLVLDIILVGLLYLVSPLAALLTGAGLICLAAIIYNRQGLIYFLLISAPLITPITETSEALNWVRIIFTGILIIIFAGRIWLSGEGLKPIPAYLLNPVLIIIFYVILTLFLAKNTLTAFTGLIHLIYYLAIALTVYNSFESRVNLRPILLVGMAMGMGLAAGLILTYGTGILRVGLLGINPNKYVLILLIGFGFGMYSFLLDNLKILRIPAIATMVLTSLAIITTGSRGGWLAFFVFVVSFLMLCKKKKTLLLIFAGMAVAMIAVVSDLSAYFGLIQKARIFAGMTGRPEIWSGGLGVFADYPILGVGYKCTGEILRYYVDMANPLVPLLIHIPVLTGKLHNGYLQILVEFGIIGSALVLWANYRFIKYLLGNFRKTNSPLIKTTIAFGFALIFAYLCRAFYESNYLFGFLTSEILMLVIFAVIIKIVEMDKAGTL